MGRHGSDLALETADAVIVRDELGHLAQGHRPVPARPTGVVKANLVFAATMIAVLVIWDSLAPPAARSASPGHEGSTIVVGLNGLRLLRRSAWEKADQGLR